MFIKLNKIYPIQYAFSKIYPMFLIRLCAIMCINIVLIVVPNEYDYLQFIDAKGRIIKTNLS